MGGVNCVAISEDGRAIAGGGMYVVYMWSDCSRDFLQGMDGIRVWDIATKNPAAIPPPQNLRGPVTSIKWVSHRDESQRQLCFGTALGYLVFWRQHTENVSDTAT